MRIMKNISPKEVLRTISSDWKLNGITHKKAAEMLGFTNYQTLSNLISSKKYLSERQALRFQSVFHYNKEFLTKGEGQLKTEEAFEETFNKITHEQIIPTGKFDWNAYRREAAKDILCAMLSGPCACWEASRQVDSAVSYADTLIEKLKAEHE